MLAKLTDQWKQMHEPLRANSAPSFPAKPPEVFEPGPCFQLQWCVCQEGSQESNADMFYRNIIKLIKPSVAAIRQKKDKEKSDASQKRKPEYPPQRKLLEGGFLVLRLSPHESCDPEALTLADRQSAKAMLAATLGPSWAQASFACAGMTDVDDLDDLDLEDPPLQLDSTPVWIHVSYMNFQNYEGAGVRLVQASEPHGEADVIPLDVPDPLDVGTFRDFIVRLNMKIAWVGTWFEILSDTKPVSMQDLKANRLHVVRMKEPTIPSYIYWKGSEKELLKQKTEQAKRTRNNQASRAPRPKREPLSKTAQRVLQDVGDSDLNSEQVLPGLSLDIEPASDSDVTGSEPAEEDPLSELCDLAQAVAAALDSSSDDKTASKPAEPATPATKSSGSSAPAEVPRAGAEAVERTAAVSRKKEVTEDVFHVPGYGDIRYNPKTKVLTAHCSCDTHGSHQCKRQRTTQPPSRKTLSNIGQGRPLGLLGAWLLAQSKYADHKAHVGVHSQKFSRKDRLVARRHLQSLQGYTDFLEFERPKETGEESEPETIL